MNSNLQYRYKIYKQHKTKDSKSNTLTFTFRNVNSDCGPADLLADFILEDVQGFTHQNSLKFIFKYRVVLICTKSTSGIFILRSLVKFSIQVLLTEYHGLICPRFGFGGACTNNQFLRAFRLQRKVIQIIAKLNSESYPPAFKKLQLSTLPSLYIFKTISFYMSNKWPWV